MAEQILFNLAEKIVSKLGSYVFKQLNLIGGVRKAFKKLEDTMTIVRNVLVDAEEKQEKNYAIREWLERLKFILYEADDLVDEFATEALRKMVEDQGQGSKRRKVREFFSNSITFRYDIGRRVKDVRLKLDQILTEMKGFELAINLVETKPEPKGREETFSFVHSSEIIGRERDRDRLVDKIMFADKGSVIPIVGPGGLGKTTLAQLMINDSRIAGEFDQLIWLWVSDDFDVKKIAIKMLQVLGEESNCDKLALEELQYRLREELKAEKYLLVLDDVWNEDPVEWTKLRDLLISLDGESVMLVTTRSNKVSSIMGTVPSYNLKGLSDEDCLSIFEKWAFNKGDEKRYPNLVDVGKEIVEKCHGVPLAARSIGGLLYMKTEMRDWLAVRDSELWATAQNEYDSMPILRLSYDQMPSYLKQCFAYCSLFKKDKLVDKWMLIYLWMAQGYIRPSNEDEQLEDIGERYINDLVKRSFLEETTLGPNREMYLMHDLVHDLAQYVSGCESLRISSSMRSIPERLRHASFEYSTEDKLEPLFKLDKLRTFLASDEMVFTRGCDGLGQEVISSFTYLRVLKLTGNIVELPNSIGDLKHLRSLLIDTLVGMTLPDSIGKLLNLHHLHLGIRWDPEVSMFELPQAIGNLVNLRYLSLYSSCLASLPMEISKLISLQRLKISIALQLRSLSEGMQFLHCLRFLEIRGCPLLTSLPPGMKGLIALEELYISTCEDLSISDDDLQGLKSLRMLTFYDLPKLACLPQGLQESAATLRRIQFTLCSNLTTLSTLEYFTSLQTLEIHHCLNLLSLPEGMECLAELRSLTIKGCPTLSERCLSGGEDSDKIANIRKTETDYERSFTYFDASY